MSDNKPNKPEKPSRGEKHDKKDKVDKGGFASLFGTDGGEDGNGGRNWRSILLYLLIAAILVFLIFGVVNQGNSRDVHELATSEFVAAVDENRVHEATYSARLGTVEGTFWPKEDEVGDDEKLADYTSTYIGEDSLAELMAAHPNIVYKADVSSTPFWVSMLSSLLPMLLLIGVMVYFMNKFADPNSGAMQFGKTKAQTTDATRPKVKFDDVAGCDEAIEELKEIKDFLEDPDKYQEIGAKIPRGVLLVGPPGTGKTLLAKAVAGEAGVPFFSISGSGFVEMFVGVGASRVRDLFSKAKEQAPSIIFIDEIDAVGRQRGAGVGGGHDEREQTLNQLLVEMDGFEDHQSVILIAATNRPDILDPALLRPGRFDRQITVDRPDVKGREEILQIHARNKPLSTDVDLDKIAHLTPGFSGADLGNLMNEAALLSARRGRPRIGMTEITESMERVIAGPARKSRVMTEDERTTIAFHESGHALVGHKLPNADPVQKIEHHPPRAGAGLHALDARGGPLPPDPRLHGRRHGHDARRPHSRGALLQGCDHRREQRPGTRHQAGPLHGDPLRYERGPGRPGVRRGQPRGLLGTRLCRAQRLLARDRQAYRRRGGAPAQRGPRVCPQDSLRQRRPDAPHGQGAA